jgi:hypothetical protein
MPELANTVPVLAKLHDVGEFDRADLACCFFKVFHRAPIPMLNVRQSPSTLALMALTEVTRDLMWEHFKKTILSTLDPECDVAMPIFDAPAGHIRQRVHQGRRVGPP